MLNENILGATNISSDITVLTQSEYDALPSSKLTDNEIYFISDGKADEESIQPVLYVTTDRTEYSDITIKVTLNSKTYSGVFTDGECKFTLDTLGIYTVSLEQDNDTIDEQTINIAAHNKIYTLNFEDVNYTCEGLLSSIGITKNLTTIDEIAADYDVIKTLALNQISAEYIYKWCMKDTSIFEALIATNDGFNALDSNKYLMTQLMSNAKTQKILMDKRNYSGSTSATYSTIYYASLPITLASDSYDDERILTRVFFDQSSAEADRIKTVIVQGSNDGTNYTDIATLSVADSQIQILNVYNSVRYTSYQIIATEVYSSDYNKLYFNNIGFSTFKCVDTVVNKTTMNYPDIVSAACDTIYYYDTNGNQVTLCTTDSDGYSNSVSINMVDIVNGLTLYSTVAKDTTNGTTNYSQKITIAGSIDSNNNTRTIHLMPDGAIYWYGYEAQELTVNTRYHYCSSFTDDTYWATQALTKNTNTLSCSQNTLHMEELSTPLMNLSSYTKICGILHDKTVKSADISSVSSGYICPYGEYYSGNMWAYQGICIAPSTSGYLSTCEYLVFGGSWSSTGNLLTPYPYYFYAIWVE